MMLYFVMILKIHFENLKTVFWELDNHENPGIFHSKIYILIELDLKEKKCHH